jgi:hypothetical protein
MTVRINGKDYEGIPGFAGVLSRETLFVGILKKYMTYALPGYEDSDNWENYSIRYLSPIKGEWAELDFEVPFWNSEVDGDNLVLQILRTITKNNIGGLTLKEGLSLESSNLEPFLKFKKAILRDSEIEWGPFGYKLVSEERYNALSRSFPNSVFFEKTEKIGEEYVLSFEALYLGNEPTLIYWRPQPSLY